MTETASQIGEKLLAARKRTGLSRARAGELIGVDQQTVYRWEKGERRPSAEDYLKAMDIYTKHGGWTQLGIDHLVPRGTVRESRTPYDPSGPNHRMAALAQKFEREMARLGATDEDLDYVHFALTDPQSAKLSYMGGSGRMLSAEEQEHQFALFTEALRIWVANRIADRKASWQEPPPGTFPDPTDEQ